MKIYCDSSTKEACIVLEGQEPIRIPYLESVTNNVGEYRAVILALEEARNRQLDAVQILTDSQLVVNQVLGTWKCRKEHLLPLRDEVLDLLRWWDLGYPVFCDLTWIPREENLAGRVLDGK